MFCVKPIKYDIMKKFSIKIHKVHKYSDPTNRFRTEIVFGLVGNDIMGLMTMSSDYPDLPTIKSVFGPFDPESILNIEKTLIETEKSGKIANVSFEEEIELEGVEISVPKSSMMMN